MIPFIFFWTALFVLPPRIGAQKYGSTSCHALKSNSSFYLEPLAKYHSKNIAGNLKVRIRKWKRRKESLRKVFFGIASKDLRVKALSIPDIP